MRLALLVALAACTGEASPPEIPDHPTDDHPTDDHPIDDLRGEDDLATAAELDEDVSESTTESFAATLPAVTRHVFGTTVQEQALIYYKITPTQPNGKKAFLTFALHGFEDAWAQDGRALFSIAHKIIQRYGGSPGKLAGWTLYVVPTANPDGMRYGVNNLREQSGAYGRCTSRGKDINRNVGHDTSIEQAELVALFDAIDPTIAIDFHGWYNTYYGDSSIGQFFQDAFDASFAGKPARYCFVGSSGAMDCGPTLGGTFHGRSTISSGLFAEWVRSQRGIPAVLVEYPAPDWNLNGRFDTLYDDNLGYRRIRSGTLTHLANRTFVALDKLFVDY